MYRLQYQPKIRNYTPDFILENGIIIEAKGWFRADDRTKMLLVNEQWPQLDIRLLFEKADNTLSKRSKTTYKEWAEKHGFIWAEGLIPLSWINEPKRPYNIDEILIKKKR